jgi:hypothetical protein
MPACEARGGEQRPAQHCSSISCDRAVLCKGATSGGCDWSSNV